ncbi:MAG: aspartate 1-decarboxylase autocleavage activator PanM [Plesiomonas sp.]|uniref:aspartate 1-decarboxylase autocleavage activator PanM n=1 Tax=Plesiomonas sp. TaxID=2486279 RepID=UPI003F3B003F
MKLTIERLTELTFADQADLAKLWPHAQVQEWQQAIQLDNGLLIARFNDRILAGVKVSAPPINSQRAAGVLKTAELYDLCVRAATRRRGVGRYLLQQLPVLMPEYHRWIITLPHTDDPDYMQENRTTLALFLLQCGWQQQGTYFSFSQIAQ